MLSSLVLSLALAADEPPAFQAEIEVILRVVTVRVTDDDRFVRGLTREAFEVLEDGKPRPIQTFEEVSYPTHDAAGVPGATSSGFTSPPRHFLFVLDRARRGRPAVFRKIRERLEEIVDDDLLPGDVVAVAQYAQQKDIVKDFTADRERIKTNIRAGDVDDGKLRTFVHELPNDDWDPLQSPFLAAVASGQGRGVDMAFGEKLERFFEGQDEERFFRFLESLGQGLSVVPEPKVVIVATGGFDLDLAIRGRNELHRRAERAMASLAGSGAQVYFLDASGLAVRAGPAAAAATRREHDSLQWLAELAGGQFFRNSNDYKGALGKVIEREAGHYIIGYSSTDTRDDDAHEIEVKVRGDGLKVLAPSAFLAPPEYNRTPESSRRIELIRMATLRQPRGAIEVGLGTAVVRGPGKEPLLVLGLDIPASEHERDVHLQAESWSGLFRTVDRRVGVEAQRMGFELPVAPGVMNLSVAVRDRETGAAGTRFITIDVPDLSADPSASLVSFEDAAIPPTTLRPDPEGRLGVILEVYGIAEGAPRPPIEASWSAGELVLSEVERHRLAPRDGAARLKVLVDTRQLEPGEHILRATVGLAGSQDPLRLTLPFEK